MSISSAPSRTAAAVWASLTASGACPDGNAVATLARCTPEPASRAAATGTIDGYTHTAATAGQDGSPGSGRRALAHSARTLPGVSAPSSVVRSTIRIARSSAQALAVVLIERVPSIAARCSAPTWSTPGRPCRNARSAASERATSPRSGVRSGVTAVIPASLRAGRPGDAGAAGTGYLVRRGRTRGGPPAGQVAPDRPARLPYRAGRVPGGAARTEHDARVRGDPERGRAGVPDRNAGRDGTGCPAGTPTAARTRAVGRPRHGRRRAGPAARVVDGLRRARARRGDVRAPGIPGVAAGRPVRTAGDGAGPDARHRRLAGGPHPAAGRPRLHRHHGAVCARPAPGGGPAGTFGAAAAPRGGPRRRNARRAASS